jgi:hypothetical protein
MYGGQKEARNASPSEKGLHTLWEGYVGIGCNGNSAWAEAGVCGCLSGSDVRALKVIRVDSTV